MPPHLHALALARPVPPPFFWATQPLFASGLFLRATFAHHPGRVSSRPLLLAATVCSFTLSPCPRVESRLRSPPSRIILRPPPSCWFAPLPRPIARMASESLLALTVQPLPPVLPCASAPSNSCQTTPPSCPCGPQRIVSVVASAEFDCQKHAVMLCQVRPFEPSVVPRHSKEYASQRFELIWESRSIAGAALVAAEGCLFLFILCVMILTRKTDQPPET